MKNYFTLLFFCHIFPFVSSAQNHDHHMFFGYKSGGGGMTLNFNLKPARIYKELKPFSLSAYSCTMSDSSGRYIFSTNGLSIYNSQFEIMEGGEQINPGHYWYKWMEEDDAYQSSFDPFAVPAPGRPNVYYLFHIAIEKGGNTIDLLFVPKPFYYSVIDMNANNGLGRVIKANQVLLNEEVTPLAITKHGNGRDWWIVIGRYDEPLQYVYLLSPAGLLGPYEQWVGPDFPLQEGGGNPMFSPDGKTYIRADARNGMRIFDFDRCTGKLSNLRILPYSMPFYLYGLVYSPSSRFVYGTVTSFQEIVQLDMKALDLGKSIDTVGITDGFVSPFLPLQPDFWRGSCGPDGKIYMCSTGGTDVLHVINKPEMPGISCDFALHSIKMPAYNYWTMPYFPNYRLGRWQDSPCDTLPFTASEDRFNSTAYEPQRAVVDTSYRLLTPIPDKGAPPSIYFTRKNRPDPPGFMTWWIEQVDRNPLLLQETPQSTPQTSQKQ